MLAGIFFTLKTESELTKQSQDGQNEDAAQCGQGMSLLSRAKMATRSRILHTTAGGEFTTWSQDGGLGAKHMSNSLTSEQYVSSLVLHSQVYLFIVVFYRGRCRRMLQSSKSPQDFYHKFLSVSGIIVCACISQQWHPVRFPISPTLNLNSQFFWGT